MNKSASPLIPILSVATTIFVWAAAFPAITLTLKEIDPLPLAAVRFAIAASFAMIWLAWARPRMMPLADLAWCIVCGIVSGVGYSVFLNLGQETVSAGAASFLVKTESLWMAAFAVFLLKERFTGWAWAGMLACVVGVGLIAAAQPGGITLGTGAPLVLAAALCSAAGFTLQRGLALRHGASRGLPHGDRPCMLGLCARILRCRPLRQFALSGRTSRNADRLGHRRGNAGSCDGDRRSADSVRGNRRQFSRPEAGGAHRFDQQEGLGSGRGLIYDVS
ncbi:DMT family transporter [Sinorhizobium fredii]